MIEIAESINSFALNPQQSDSAPPQEQIFVLTSNQLRDIISRAVEKAVQPLQERIEALEEISARERALDRQRISALECSEPQPLQKDRGEILRALIAANGGKMLAKEARKKMRLSRSQFSQLLSTMKDHIEIKPYNLRKNENLLILK